MGSSRNWWSNWSWSYNLCCKFQTTWQFVNEKSDQNIHLRHISQKTFRCCMDAGPNTGSDSGAYRDPTQIYMQRLRLKPGVGLRLGLSPRLCLRLSLRPSWRLRIRLRPGLRLITAKARKKTRIEPAFKNKTEAMMKTMTGINYVGPQYPIPSNTPIPKILVDFWRWIFVFRANDIYDWLTCISSILT